MPKVRHENKTGVQKRIAYYRNVFDRLIENFEVDHPNWRLEALVRLMKYALVNLRHHIETSPTHQFGLDGPFLNLEHQIDWNWDVWNSGPFTGISVKTGKLTSANTKTKQLATKTLGEILARHVTLIALQDFTNNVGFEKRGINYTPILGSDVGKLLASIKKKSEQRRFLELLFNPFSMGASSIDLDVDKMVPNTPIPKPIARKFALSNSLLHPPIRWTCKMGEHQFEILLIFQIHPFIVDFDARQAHYPITVGLQFAPIPSGDQDLLKFIEEPWINTQEWKKGDRDRFWQKLLKGLDELAEEQESQTSKISDAVVSVNAKIKLTPRSSSLLPEEVMAKMLDQFNKTGEVLKWDCSTQPVAIIARKLQWTEISAEEFERLLFNLVSTTPGYENPEWLTHTNATDKGRDISVLRVFQDNLAGARRLRTIIQCKHTKSVGIAEVSRIRDQMSLLEPPRVDELIIATTGRLSSDAVSMIEKHNQSDKALRIGMWTDSHLERLLAERPHLIREFGL